MQFHPGESLRAAFIDRPNRFLVRCRLGGRTVRAFMPNPGRMWELLYPGVPLIIVREGGPKRKTHYTVLAVERDGQPVFLHTHLTNAVARHLLLEHRIPGLEGCTLVRSEVTRGNSRLDFLLNEQGRDVYVEVKSCTLFGNGVAMFPDAVTERGRKHLIELSHLARQGARCVALFLVQTPRVEWFMPDYHTDLAFSRTLLDVRDDVEALPVSVSWTAGLDLGRRVRRVDVPWAFIEREAKDGGSYLLLMELERRRAIEVGSLGRVVFERGHYVYVGSAMKGLAARMARHVRRRKRMHWHVDYLRQHAAQVVPIPIRSSRREECELAAAVAKIVEAGPVGFGCSDCGCATHLFRSAGDPLGSPAFHRLVERFRMRPPGERRVVEIGGCSWLSRLPLYV
ncbi:DNA/RNA nuclease SfsA [bacterium]|nr:DNA/RNA nuclease SfsA [bacterium]